MKEFWFTAICILLCGVIAMVLIIVGVNLDDQSIPPETTPDGELVPPPGFEIGAT